MPPEDLRLVIINALIKDMLANINMCQEFTYNDVADVLKVTVAALEKIKNLPSR